MKRIFHEIFARTFGYFWRCCPRCGKTFGGHEVARILRTGSILTACREEDHRFSLLLCPACHGEMRDTCPPPSAPTPPPRGHLIYYALYSGAVILNEENEDMYSLPGTPFADYMFWSNMRLGTVAIYIIFMTGALFGFVNIWTHIGLALGFLLSLICNRLAPPLSRFPMVIAGIQTMNLAMALIHLSWFFWRSK